MTVTTADAHKILATALSPLYAMTPWESKKPLVCAFCENAVTPSDIAAISYATKPAGVWAHTICLPTDTSVSTDHKARLRAKNAAKKRADQAKTDEKIAKALAEHQPQTGQYDDLTVNGLRDEIASLTGKLTAANDEIEECDTLMTETAEYVVKLQEQIKQLQQDNDRLRAEATALLG